MRVEISGRNYEVNDRVRELINNKLSKITKYFSDIIEIRCVLNVEKYRNICEIIIVGKTYDAKSLQEADTMDEAINSTIDHLKRQAERNHNRVREHKRRKAEPTEWTINVLEPGMLREGDSRPRIIHSSNIAIRPMSIEQAAMHLEDSKNQFVVFRDLDTERVTVIYRRRDNNFGMIAPEF